MRACCSWPAAISRLPQLVLGLRGDRRGAAHRRLLFNAVALGNQPNTAPGDRGFLLLLVRHDGHRIDPADDALVAEERQTGTIVWSTRRRWLVAAHRWKYLSAMTVARDDGARDRLHAGARVRERQVSYGHISPAHGPVARRGRGRCDRTFASAISRSQLVAGFTSVVHHRHVHRDVAAREGRRPAAGRRDLVQASSANTTAASCSARSTPRTSCTSCRSASCS